MRRTYERGTKARLSFSGGPHAPVNMADSMEEVNVRGKDAEHGTLATLAIFRTTRFRKSLNAIRHVYRSLALVPRSYVLRMTEARL